KTTFILVAILGLLVIPVLSGIVLLGLSGAKEKARDARIIVGIGQIRSAAEIYYNSNDNSYIGFQNDPQVRSVIEDIKSTGGQVRFGQINEESYVVWSSLISDPNKFYCVDSGGFACQLAGDPIGGQEAVKCRCPE
ncbi:MAG: hypothetical protein Q8L57_01000, partial [bacterium]|nr:hypothetical protein [bacterium]